VVIGCRNNLRHVSTQKMDTVDTSRNVALSEILVAVRRICLFKKHPFLDEETQFCISQGH